MSTTAEQFDLIPAEAIAKAPLARFHLPKPPAPQMELGLLEEIDNAAAAAHLDNRRRRNLESCRGCWPEWKGPRVSDDVHGRATSSECGQWYCAPCRILEVLDGGNAFRCVVDYPPTAPQWCLSGNGTEIIIDLSEIWPPTDELWAIRRGEEDNSPR